MSEANNEYAQDVVVSAFQALTEGKSLDDGHHIRSGVGRSARIRRSLESGTSLDVDFREGAQEIVEAAFQKRNVERPSWNVAECCNVMLRSR